MICSSVQSGVVVHEETNKIAIARVKNDLGMIEMFFIRVECEFKDISNETRSWQQQENGRIQIYYPFLLAGFHGTVF